MIQSRHPTYVFSHHSLCYDSHYTLSVVVVEDVLRHLQHMPRHLQHLHRRSTRPAPPNPPHTASRLSAATVCLSRRLPTLTTSSTIRPLVRRPFLADGRAPLTLDRGSFQNARAYYRAFTSASLRLPARSTSTRRARGCRRWRTIRALRQAGGLSSGVRHSWTISSSDVQGCVFHTASIAGAAAFMRALDSENDSAARCAARWLDDLADYDVFRNGFLLLPTLENMCALCCRGPATRGATLALRASTCSRVPVCMV